MSNSPPSSSPTPPPPLRPPALPPGDPSVTREGRVESGDEGADGYARGFGDGVRSALKEVTGLASRGHTASEIRLFAETRIAHLGEEVEMKRRSLLSPPRRLPVEALLRVKLKDHEGPRAFPPIALGSSYLFFEPTPRQARAFTREVVALGCGALIMTRLPQEARPPGSGSRVAILHLGAQHTGPAGEDGVESIGDSDPGQLTGRLSRFFDSTPPPAAVVLEAFEFLYSESGFDKALKFVHWLNALAAERKGFFILALDPESLDKRQASLLRRDFNHEIMG